MDIEETRAAYLRAVGHEVTPEGGLLGLRAAQTRLMALLDAGERLVRALEKHADMNDPDVKAALANWEDVR
jgi:hypothetical protein